MERGLLFVCRRTVPTLGILIEIGLLVAHLLHPRRHFTRVRRVDPVITGGGVKQHRRIRYIGFDVVIRRESLDVRPLFRFARVAVFGNP
ncbi:hypothetical protein D3C76_1497890 [compost metagenome]